eukprot:11954115-Alexandrium_andersonii.AAC.1
MVETVKADQESIIGRTIHAEPGAGEAERAGKAYSAVLDAALAEVVRIAGLPSSPQNPSARPAPVEPKAGE